THTPRVPMIRLLAAAFDEFSDELTRRVLAAGYTDIRPGHGCVFGNIEPDGSRLTDLADRAGMTKQSVGEVTSDLEQRGYPAWVQGADAGCLLAEQSHPAPRRGEFSSESPGLPATVREPGPSRKSMVVVGA